MPGLVGVITKLSRECVEPQLLRMVEALRHDESYQTGIWMDEVLGVYLGWAIPKNSFCDGMPFVNERGDLTLIFSGEEYPEPGMARRLKARGHVLDEEGCSYLIHLMEESRGSPACLNGRFHAVLIDKTHGTATLFNDRYGIGRIYYHESKDGFYFSAEAKAILAIRPELRAVDVRSLGEYVACGCVLQNRTLFKGIEVLPPASAWVFRPGQIDRKGFYFQPQEWENQDLLGKEAYYHRIREVFSRNLPRYFKAGQRIGVSLTGGLDTRMIMAWHKSAQGSLPCYSFGGTFRDSEDVRLARQVAQICGQPHEVIEIGKSFLNHFPDYADRTVYLTDGCASVSRSPDLFANEKAAKIAPIRMTGNYGSEILRRLVAFKPTEPGQDLFEPEFLSHVRAGIETYRGLVCGHALSFIAFRQVPWHHYGLLALEQTQLSVRSPFLDNELVQTAFRAPNSGIAEPDIFADNDEWLRLVEEGNPSLRRIRTDRGVGGHSGRLSAALSRSLLEFTFRAEYAYDYGMPQWLTEIDHLFSALKLERLFLGRHKFYHFRVWYRDQLSKYVQEILFDPRTLSRSYIDPHALQSLVRAHLNGHRNHTTELHTLLTLEYVQRNFIDGNCSVACSNKDFHEALSVS
jgi:asparagine synthase (glutamine-hydrolysing)